MEKCRDITVGYTTEQKCDKWPQQVCTLDKVISKNTTPDTKVSSFKPIANMKIWYKTLLNDKSADFVLISTDYHAF